MRHLRIDRAQTIITPGQAPQVRLFSGERNIGVCEFHRAGQAPAERGERDPEGFVTLHFDAGQFEEVKAVVGRMPLWIPRDGFSLQSQR